MRQERYGVREFTYSRWHRTLDDDLTYIDIDADEYCRQCRAPLALLETARDVGQQYKATTAMRHLAKRADVQAFCVLYKADAHDAITQFSVRRVYPEFGPWTKLTPDQFAETLRYLRYAHECDATAATFERAIEEE